MFLKAASAADDRYNYNNRLICEDPFITYLKPDNAMNDLNNHYQTLTTINFM